MHYIILLVSKVIIRRIVAIPYLDSVKLEIGCIRRELSFLYSHVWSTSEHDPILVIDIRKIHFIGLLVIALFERCISYGES